MNKYAILKRNRKHVVVNDIIVIRNNVDSLKNTSGEDYKSLFRIMTFVKQQIENKEPVIIPDNEFGITIERI